MANINDFKAKLAGGGARANQFKVTMPFPGYSQVGGEIEELAFLCKTTQLPALTIPSFTIPFRGRQIKIAGDRTYAEWTITVLNDTNFKLRNAFERWSNGINNATFFFSSRRRHTRFLNVTGVQSVLFRSKQKTAYEISECGTPVTFRNLVCRLLL